MKGWNWKGTRYSPIVIGIGSHFVHMVQLKEREGEITRIAAEAVPIDSGDDRVKSVAQAVRTSLGTGAFKGGRAALCLKGSDIFIQHQRMSLEGVKDVAKRVREELKSRVPFDLDRAEIRYINTGRVYERSELVDELILMIADREVTDRNLAILDALKLRAEMISAEPLGLLRAILHFPPEGVSTSGVFGFLDIAASKTELLIVRKGRLAFTRSLPMGGEMFTRAVAEKLGIDLQGAARLKAAISRNESINDTLRSAAMAAVRPVLDEMCTEILSCFRYFSAIFNRESVDRLVLSGQEVGGLVTPKFMESQTGVTATPWNPGELFSAWNDPGSGQAADFGFIPIVGLALEMLRPSETRVDFMPGEVLEGRSKTHSMAMRGVSLALLLFLMFVFLLITHQRREKLALVRTMVQGQCNLIDMKQVKALSLEEEEKTLENRRIQLLQTRPLVRTSRILAEVALAAGDRVTLRQLNLDKVVPQKTWNKTEARLQGGNNQSCSYLIHLKGLARTSNEVSAFVERLFASKAFSSIRDEGSDDEVMQELNLISFSLILMVGGRVDREVF